MYQLMSKYSYVAMFAYNIHNTKLLDTRSLAKEKVSIMHAIGVAWVTALPDVCL